MIKYGLLGHVVTEIISGHILNLKIYVGEGKKIQEIFGTLS